MEAEAKLAKSRKLRRRRAYRARRKQRQRAEKAAKLDLQIESLGRSLGGSLGAKYKQSTATQPSVPNQGVTANTGEITSKTLPPNIVDVVTIEDSSESEEESEFIKILRKYGSFY